jgi:hypothetical protein
VLRIALCLAVISACGGDPPPFTFVLVQGSDTVLLEQMFANYDEGRAAGTFTVVVTSGGASMEVSKEVGFCAVAAKCAGPIAVERLTLTVSPDRPDHVLGYFCDGLDGTLTGGVDVSGTGDCSR